MAVEHVLGMMQQWLGSHMPEEYPTWWDKLAHLSSSRSYLELAWTSPQRDTELGTTATHARHFHITMI